MAGGGGGQQRSTREGLINESTSSQRVCRDGRTWGAHHSVVAGIGIVQVVGGCIEGHGASLAMRR